MNDEEADTRAHAAMPQYPPYPPYPPFPPYPPIVIMGCCHGNGHGAPSHAAGQTGVAGFEEWGDPRAQMMNVRPNQRYIDLMREQEVDEWEKAKEDVISERRSGNGKPREEVRETAKPAPAPAASSSGRSPGFPPPPPPINPLDPVGSVYNVVSWLFGQSQ